MYQWIITHNEIIDKNKPIPTHQYKESVPNESPATKLSKTPSGTSMSLQSTTATMGSRKINKKKMIFPFKKPKRPPSKFTTKIPQIKTKNNDLPTFRISATSLKTEMKTSKLHTISNSSLTFMINSIRLMINFIQEPVRPKYPPKNAFPSKIHKISIRNLLPPLDSATLRKCTKAAPTS